MPYSISQSVLLVGTPPKLLKTYPFAGFHELRPSTNPPSSEFEKTMANETAEACTVTADCSNVYHTCGYNGYCDCPWLRGTTGPKCSVESAEARGFLALNIIYLVIWAGVAAYQTYALARVLRVGRRGAVRKFAIFLTLGLVIATVRELCRTISIVSPDSYGAKPSQTFQLVDQPLLVFSSSTAVAGAMCQGLMWIEFVLASKQMAQMGNDLRFSAKLLNGSMVTYVTLSALCTALFLFVSTLGFLMFIVITAVSMTLLSICYLYGAHKMSLVYGRISGDLKSEATRAKTTAKTMTTMVDNRMRASVEDLGSTGRPMDTEQSEADLRRSQEEEEEEREEMKRDEARRQSAIQHMELQAASFDLKARRTTRCARTVACGLLTNVVSVLIWEAANRLHAYQPVIWLFNTLLWAGLWVAAYAMTDYCLFTTRVTRVAPAPPPSEGAAYQA